jgi:hypothetical protein
LLRYWSLSDNNDREVAIEATAPTEGNVNVDSARNVEGVDAVLSKQEEQ